VQVAPHFGNRATEPDDYPRTQSYFPLIILLSKQYVCQQDLPFNSEVFTASATASRSLTSATTEDRVMRQSCANIWPVCIVLSTSCSYSKPCMRQGRVHCMCRYTDPSFSTYMHIGGSEYVHSRRLITVWHSACVIRIYTCMRCCQANSQAKLSQEHATGFISHPYIWCSPVKAEVFNLTRPRCLVTR